MPRQVETSRRLYVVRERGKDVDISDEELFLVVRSTNEKRMSLFAIPAIVLQDEPREPSWGDQAPLARIIHIEVNNLPSGRNLGRGSEVVERLRLRPACAGRRSGLALSPAPGARRIIHEDTPFVNNAG